MAKLRQRQDGGHYTALRIRGNNIVTCQIHPEGVDYLHANGVVPEMEIPSECKQELWDQGWFYTKGQMEAGTLDLDPEELDEADELDLSILTAVRDTDVRWGVLDEELEESQATDPQAAFQADRPLFLFDSRFNVYYTVIHLQGISQTDPVVMCVKFRAAQWLQSSGARVGKPLPEGALSTLFVNRWLYPIRDWTPEGAEPRRG